MDNVNKSSPGGGTPSATVSDETSFGIATDAGASADYSRGDHTHGSPTAPTLLSVTTSGDYTTVSSKFQNAVGLELGKNDGGGNTTGVMKFWSAGVNNFYTTITANTNTGNLGITLPAAAPAATYILNMTNAGVMGYDTSAYLTSVTAHNLLSATHGDTTAGAAVLGGLIYADATPKWVELPGNTTATKKYLSQQGNGAISAVPVWDVVTASMPDMLLTKRTITADTTVTDGYSALIVGDCEISSGFVLELGADGVLEIT